MTDEFDKQAREIAETIICQRKLKIQVAYDENDTPIGSIASEDTVPVAVALISSALRAAAEREREAIDAAVRAIHWGTCTPTSAPYNLGLNSGAETMREEILTAIRARGNSNDGR